MSGALPSLLETAAKIVPRRVRLLLYRLGPVTDLLRRVVNRSVPRGVHPVQIAAGELTGKWLLLDLQVDKDFWLGHYEPELAAAIRRFVPAGAVAYDLGANVGYTALLLAQAVGPGGQVIAFEPLPANLDRLRQAARLNGVESLVTIVPAAVGARRERAEFHIHTSGAMGRLDHGSGREPPFVGSTTVEVVALDDFVFSQGYPAPQAAKLDLEGGEGPALQGMARLLSLRRPILLLEIHGDQAAAEVVRELERAGYSLHAMSSGYPSLAGRPPSALPRHVVALPDGVAP